MTDATQHGHALAGGALIDGLVRAGVRHFCVCPGSRSTPLALLIEAHPDATLWMHYDERSAAFFALGLAKSLREPVALACTSGTAAANFLPAVVEAYHSRVPLVVLTADRPHELREVGAPQAIDQVRLFGSHAKWFFDMAETDTRPDIIRAAAAIAARAALVAWQFPAGPVHLNCPFREPLVPVHGEVPVWEWPAKQIPFVATADAPRAPTPTMLDTLVAAVARHERGLIICGPQDDPALPDALLELAGATGYPLLADPLSGLRHYTRPLNAYDAFLRDEAFAAGHAPELVLRFGAMPVAKPLLQFVQRHRGAETIVIDGAAGVAWPDPAQTATCVLAADGTLLARALAAQVARRGASMWHQHWQRAEQVARAAIQQRMDDRPGFFEGRVFAELHDLLPDGATLFVSNSMPIRDLDTFFAGGRAVRLMCNRGANGIDGVVSTALGVAATGDGPLVLAIGDLALYHDANGLLAAKLHQIDATIVLINNDGGGIFSFLPQASQVPRQFERLFGTPHGLDFAPLAALYGASFEQPQDWDAFRSAVRARVGSKGLHIIEVRTSRQENVPLHRELWQVMADALRAEGL